jgi:hypothetical protein
MISLKTFLAILILPICICVSGCVSTPTSPLDAAASQVQLRNIQTRGFDTSDKKLMLQTVMSAMQDLDFVLQEANMLLGVITGTKFLGQAAVVMTVTVRAKGETQLLVRANAQKGIHQVDDAEVYQDFFTTLEKALFLTAHQID